MLLGVLGVSGVRGGALGGTLGVEVVAMISFPEKGPPLRDYNLNSNFGPDTRRQ